jgi:hypothetical protein
MIKLPFSSFTCMAVFLAGLFAKGHRLARVYGRRMSAQTTPFCSERLRGGRNGRKKSPSIPFLTVAIDSRLVETGGEGNFRELDWLFGRRKS